MSDPVVVLIGAPGAGKSRIGRKVANRLDVDFIDTDSSIVQNHGAIADIFLTMGEAGFRSLEREFVAEALNREAVVSLGGGAVMDAETSARLRECRVVLLTVSPEAVAKRISGGKRPLLAEGTGDERLAAWQRLVDSRRERYESLAKRTWDTSQHPISRIAGEIADWVVTDRIHHDKAGTSTR